MSNAEVKGSNLQQYQSVMAKRSQRRLLRHERDQGGCISGFMSIFDFRHGHSTRKLLADRRRGSRQSNASTSGSSGTIPAVTKADDKCDDTKEAEKSGTARDDAVKTSVKKLMEEEMVHEQIPEKQIGVSKEGSEEFKPEHGNRARKHHRRRSRTSRKSIDNDIYDGDSSRNMEPENLGRQINEQKISDNIDLETIIEELRQIHLKSSDSFKNDLNNDLDMPSDQAEEKLNAAIKVFMSQKLSNNMPSREDGSTHHSKEFIDALQTISSNKELFLKLLQDPNSTLVKHINGFEGALLTNEVPTKSELDDPIIHKPRKFFRRRSKSQDSYPVEGDETRHSSSKIVILKPGSAGSLPGNGDNMTTSLDSRYSFDNKVQGDNKHASNFSFSEIKRRLKHAIGKEQQNRGETEKRVGGENYGWSSPNRNHFYNERFAKPSTAKKGDKIAKAKDVEAADINESSEHPKKGVSNIYIEAKKHLSEMLNNGETDPELIKGQSPKSLGRILALPEYKDSPRRSSEKIMEEKHDGYVSSPEQNIDNGIHKTGENDHETRQVPKVNCSATCEIISEDSVAETTSSTRNEILDIEETTRTTNLEEDEISLSSSPTSKDVQTDNNNNAVCNEEISMQCSESEPLEEDQEPSSPLASPPSSLVNTKAQDLEETINRTDRPSPVSVLEPVLSEDDISPASTIERQVELDILPRKIHFEEQIPSVSDQGISSVTCMEEGESPFEYVEAVLLGSGLNWDDFLLRWLSSDQILDPSLFDEVELFSSRRHDQKLLFDCTNEVLKEVCDRYFGCFIGRSFVKHRFKPPPIGMNLINEIWEGVELRLLQDPLPKSLDQLVKKDLTKSEMWMNPHLDIEHVRVEMAKAIFEDLVEDTVSCFVDDNSECTSLFFPARLHEFEISIDS